MRCNLHLKNIFFWGFRLMGFCVVSQTSYQTSPLSPKLTLQATLHHQIPMLYIFDSVLSLLNLMYTKSYGKCILFSFFDTVCSVLHLCCWSIPHSFCCWLYFTDQIYQNVFAIPLMNMSVQFWSVRNWVSSDIVSKCRCKNKSQFVLGEYVYEWICSVLL